MLIQVLLVVIAIVILGGMLYIFAYSGYQYWLWANNEEKQTDSENYHGRLIHEKKEK